MVFLAVIVPILVPVAVLVTIVLICMCLFGITVTMLWTKYKKAKGE